MSNEAEGAIIAARARNRLAQRVRLPWWFATVEGAALLGMLSAPLLPHLTSWPDAFTAVMWPSVLVLVFGDLLLRRVQGVALSRKTLWSYPSARRAALMFLVIGAAGVGAVNLLARAGRIAPGVAVAVAVAAIGTGLLWGLNAAVRRDIRSGRVVAP
ncbi:hypothetical protein ACFXPA_01120 [Amycolatopsis sp. NPDC059090]|uniref:hypothetical protein n=1 Tax=unclassified Amycolatopsis TaxID=2618356 RepID=UPI00366B2DAB